MTAAYQRFLRESYDSVGLRDIAGDAGVDVAMIGRYFGGKEGLFREVVADGQRPDLFREPQSVADLPNFFAQLLAEDGDEDRRHRMEMFIIMLRSASSPKAGEIIRARVNGDVLAPLAVLIGGKQGAMRANMLLAILMGAGVLRTIMMVGNLTNNTESRCESAERFRSLFEAALDC